MRRSQNQAIRALACAVIVFAGFLLVGVPPAGADSATLTYTTTTGTSDPVAGVSRIATLSVTSSAPTRVWAKYRAPGGAACAPSAYSDSGTQLNGFGAGFYGADVNGTATLQGAGVWSPAGTFVFCIWLSNDSTAVATPFTQTITFRRPTGTITATISPITPAINQPAVINVTGASEAPARAFAKLRRAGGAACAPTYASDAGADILDGTAVDGAFSLNATTQVATAGDYVLCLWLAQASDDPSPTAGPQPQAFSVAGPAVLAPLTRIAASATLRRRGATYSGRLATQSQCMSRRTVVLRRAGSGTRSFGRALTRPNGSFTIRRSSRVHGRVSVVVSARSQGRTVCSVGRSGSIRG